MAIRLPRLPANQRIVDPSDGTATSVLSIWWQQVVEQVESSITAIQEALDAAVAAFTAAETAQGTADAAQPGDPTLTALAALDATAGLVEQTGPDLFTKRPIGTAVNSIPRAQDVVLSKQGATWVPATGTASRTTFATYAAPTISNPPTQAEVQAIANAVQILSQHMKALIDDLSSNGALNS